ncbi:multidrug effflux MFS transporter [Microbacterium paludicola]|uniref:multidrug effflux MFS transporter n=1 Tax=Microbacterium paludicola TaxID=300019 RepID=UPI00387A3F58
MGHPPTPTRPELTPGLLAALGFVGMAGAVSTDLYLPAFPSLQADFDATPAAVQLTLTAYLIGSAAGQFLIGTVSDALGRRRTLLIALGVFTAAGFAAAAAPSLAWLVALRLVQGLSGSAGAALARAVVADLAEGERAARGISVLIGMMGLGPIFGSPLGALLTSWGGWRAALVGLAVIAAAMFAVALVVIPESLPAGDRHPARVGRLVANLGRLGRDGAFLGYALAFGLSYAGLMVYIGASSFVVQRVFGASPLEYALTFSGGSLAFVAGAWLNGRLVRRMGARRALRVGQLGALTAAAALLALARAGALSLWTWVPLVCVFTAGCAASMSDASAVTLGRAAFAAGGGSAALGLFQFALGAVASPLGGLWGDDTAVPAAAGMTAAILLSLTAAALARACERREDQRASGHPV